ncbi:MAG: MerR family transcriptional regulator [Clostridia bacterium]|nr:MerR family transcriptional regulator [Clostridia bacterium]
MLKIGEMASICKVSVQTLRYYDRLGLLCADVVDDFSGYRYYHPDKIGDYQKIRHLKDLGFSLEEIKRFLQSPQSLQTAMYSQKKNALREQIRMDRERIRQIDQACEVPEQGILSLTAQIRALEFTDDPDVVGRWDYCGDLSPDASFDGEAGLLPGDTLLKTIFFLPGGGHVWTYFWTRGILYFVLAERNIIVPNRYRTVTLGDTEYLLLNWMVDKCLTEDAADCTRIYRRVDRRAYTEKETFVAKDDLELPFVPDDRVLGKWEAFDLIRDPAGFSPHPSVGGGRGMYTGLEFFSRGQCVRFGRAGSGTHPQPLSYTAGVLLNPTMGVAEHYELRHVDGEDYLIVEHKSGDYLHLGKIFCYYVFRRKQV